MTEYQKIFDAFLAKITADDWSEDQDLDVIFSDWTSIMESALPYFKFPRCSLKRHWDEDFPEDACFEDDLNDQEIQIIATLMKKEWLDRTINTWENVKAMYDERDFSQANLIDKLNQTLEAERKSAEKLESLYYRAIKHKPFDYRRLAGS